MMPGDKKYGRPIGALVNVDGRDITGQINLKRGGLFDSNIISLYDDKYFFVGDHMCLHGVSEGRESVSFGWHTWWTK